MAEPRQPRDISHDAGPCHRGIRRALVPVRLSGGHTVTFGLWVGVNPRKLQHVFAVWWGPEYRDLRLDGALANSIPPWGLLAAPVTLTVRDPQQTPLCSESQDPSLSRVLHDQWPHADILDALP